MTHQPKNARCSGARAAVAAGLLLALAAPARAQTHLDNPFVGARMYVNPAFTANADATAAATADPALADAMRRVGRQPTAIWLEQIAAVPSVATHLDQALAAGDDLVLFVLRDLPGRDCSAPYYDGELPIDGGLARYRTEFIDPIVAIARDPRYAGIRIVFVVEPDSLVHLVTGLSTPTCAMVQSSGLYVEGIRYAVNKLHELPNVYLYLDLAYSGWLGWETNAAQMVAFLNTVSSGFTAGKNALDGFATNTAQYVPVKEPWLSAAQVVAGQQVWTAKFYEYNRGIDEASFVADMYGRLTAAGWPGSIGMIVDTSRNGWGGPGRPGGPSTQVSDLERFVNDSRVDRRAHRSLWCNVAGAGIGELPQATPPTFAATYLDAFVWVKTPGESDGASSPAPEGPPFDRECDPTYETRYGVPTSALPDAPARGRWFPGQFTELVQNMWPAEPGPVVFSLTVEKAGAGAGAVSSSPGGIACGASCSATYAPYTAVSLTATAASGSSFSGWGGACASAGAKPTCVVSMGADRQVTATFQPGTWFPLQVTLDQSGICNPPPGCVPGSPCPAVCYGGSAVTSSPAGISCGASGGACTGAFASGTSVVLTATPNPNTRNLFAGWGGACSGTARTCVVAMTQAQSVTARFVSDVNYTLSVTRAGAGAGTVTGAGGAVDCGTTCNALFSTGMTVTLTATASAGSTFTGWTGACAGTATTCAVRMDRAQAVTATFTSLRTYPLTVTKSGTGTGTVVSSPAGIQCGAACSASFGGDAVVTLTAAAATGSTFGGWSGACPNTFAACTVVMSSAREVTAIFISGAPRLTVASAGSGAGTVASSPAGLFECGAGCTAYQYGTEVTLTATAAAESTFTGWGGACTGTGACIVSMTDHRTVTATFQPVSPTPCANPITFSWNTGNFGTTSGVCYRTSQRVNGWGCSNFAGRTIRVNSGAATATCGAGPFPLPKQPDGYTYFTVTTGQYPWASIYLW